MENIDPVFVLQPVVVIVLCVALLMYWRRKRGFDLVVVWYALLAYASAIALKYAVQLPSIDAVEGYYGQASVGLGIYYGAQTVGFEVGLAFLVAWYMVRKGRMGRKDAEAYGAGLAFWENAILLGVAPLINLIIYYAILSGNSSFAPTLYNQLSSSSAGLFEPVPQALSSVALGTLERISSIMLHSAWGYLCALAAVYRKRELFYIALPMGLVDFLVPFASSLGTVLFELIVFCLALISVCIAWYAPRRLSFVGQSPSKQEAAPTAGASALPLEHQRGSSHSFCSLETPWALFLFCESKLLIRRCKVGSPRNGFVLNPLQFQPVFRSSCPESVRLVH